MLDGVDRPRYNANDMVSRWVFVGAMLGGSVIALVESNRKIPNGGMFPDLACSSSLADSASFLSREPEPWPPEVIARRSPSRSQTPELGLEAAARAGEAAFVSTTGGGSHPAEPGPDGAIRVNPSSGSPTGIPSGSGAIAQLDHGNNGKLPEVPTITHFGASPDFSYLDLDRVIFGS